ncbi:MAG: tRNA (adenosine(37)-N6)-threonylcarbamoyltransferase complex dimerization subunit type 1 TsaB [Bernardetiaceae bacterium]|nr:tRNA (adenosine(37)-N6)-threonylcarbamoyltransferase complex dimerization subunit type 1 TsaB [Bernardetiaceae bacterium]
MDKNLIISIETSTPVCAVALHNLEGKILAHSTLFSGRSHAEKLLTVIENILATTDNPKTSLAAVAISKGPGSYTGLRIGSATAKGLSYALDIPLIAINSLLAMAHGMQKSNPFKALLVPMLDARRMEVYTGIWDADLKNLKPTTPMIITENAFIEELQQQPIYFFGDGAAKCKPLIQHPNAHFIDEHQTPTAQAIGEIAVEQFHHQNFVDAAYFEPLYLKEFMIKPAKDKLRS